MGRAGLPASARFHDLRHTFATLALSSNVNPKVVSGTFGHSTVAVTLDIYLHVLPDMQADAASIIGVLLMGSDAEGVRRVRREEEAVVWEIR